MPVYGLFTVTNAFAPVVLFGLRFRKSSGRERQQLGYMLAALAVIAVAATSTLLHSSATHLLLALLPSLLMILAPSLITYAIIRHQLWDIRTVIHRTGLWIAASLLVVVPVHFLLSVATTSLVTGGSRVAWLVSLGLLGVFALYFRLLQPWLDDRFARRKHDAAKVADRFSREVVNLKGFGELALLVEQPVRSSMYAKTARMCALGQVPDGSVLPGETADNPCAALSSRARAWLCQYDDVLDVTELPDLRHVDESVRDELRRRLGGEHVEVLVPLVHEGQLIGAVTLSEKQSLRAYTREDFRLLTRIRPAATVALANAQLYDRLHDLTGSLEQRVAERTEQLQLVNDKLRDADEQRSKFFANISHELRTPLTLILGPLEELLHKLQHGAELTGAREDVQVMYRNGLRLQRQIDALLDLAKHDAGQLRLRPTEIRLGELLESCVRAFGPFARLKHIDLQLEPIPSSADDRFLGDGEKLTLVMSNLLGNALKFTPEHGRVVVSSELTEHQVCLSVADSGIGISAADQQRIFERFAQVDGGPTRRQEGVGIGLSLVKELVELHQGRVGVRSEEGKGAEFRVELPRAVDPAPERVERRQIDLPTRLTRRAEDRDPLAWVPRPVQADAWFGAFESRPQSEPPPAPRGPSHRLVVAEDNADMRAYLGRRLGELFEVTLCVDGEHALEICRARPPDLLLADVMMPRLSGLDLCRQLKDDPTTRSVPVVLLTARKGVELTLEGFDVGADDYVTKPFSFRELLARINVQLRVVDLGRALARHEKGEVLSLVAAGLAHEVRNPVNAILNAVRPLLDLSLAPTVAPEDREAYEELLRAIFESAERIDLLCSDLLGVARPHQDELSSWKIGEALDSALRLLKHKNPEGNAEVVRRIEHTRPVFVRAAQLNQVLMNLLDNAMRASGPRGTVTVSTEDADGMLLLRVRDTGRGIAPGLGDRIFDPLFTTHAKEGGKGLGLYVTRRIVEAHGGSVSARTARHGGAEFLVALPTEATASAPAPQSGRPPQVEARLRGGSPGIKTVREGEPS